MSDRTSGVSPVIFSLENTMKNEPFRKWLNGCTRNAGKSSKLSEARNKFANSSAIGGKDATEYTQKSSFGA